MPLPQFHLKQRHWLLGPSGEELLFQGFEDRVAPRSLQTPWYLSHSTTSTACKAWVLMLEQDCWPWRV